MTDLHDQLDKARHVILCRSGLRQLRNRWRFGQGAPRPHQLLHIPPSDILNRYSPRANDGQKIGSRQTGQVLAGDWDQCHLRYDASPKYKACVVRFLEGGSWEESGIIAYMLKRIAKTGPLDNCTTRADIEDRYAKLDQLWQHTQDTGRLPPAPHRARDGILVHIDRNGAPLFGNQGFHRLAITKLAKLEHVTVSLGLVHEDAVRSGIFQSRYG